MPQNLHIIPAGLVCVSNGTHLTESHAMAPTFNQQSQALLFGLVFRHLKTMGTQTERTADVGPGQINFLYTA